MITQKRRLILILLSVPLLLMIPLIAMQFTNEVNWTLLDFVVMGFLLVSTGLACELVLRKVRTHTHRIFLCIAILVILLLTWVQLAVGIF